MDLIGENVSVMLQKGKVLKAVKLECGKKIVFEKMHFKPDNAIGQPYNSWFQVSSNQLEKVEDDVKCGKEEEIAPAENELEVTPDAAQDNRLLEDTHGKSQSLRREEIVSMKASGAKGEEIIDEIVKNSSTFSSKTIYSQKKYLKKKKSKHLKNIRILKPSMRLICKMYESREPAKICHMRLDTVSQILNLANVHSGSKIIVVETCSGLLLSLVMQRLGGKGCVVNLHTGETPTNFHAITHMNYDDSFWATLNSLPLCKVGPLLANKNFKDAVGDIEQLEKEHVTALDTKAKMATPMEEDVKHVEDMAVVSNNKKMELFDGHKNKEALCTDANMPSAMEDKLNSMENTLVKIETAGNKKKIQLSEEEKCQIRYKRRYKRLQHQLCAWNMLKTKSMDAAIIAGRFHPTPVLLTMLEFLAPSRPFVVHCENREPLMELFVQLSMSSKAVNLKITETFARQYQVLPEQTHPHVMMSTSGGYLLTGFTVKTSNTGRNANLAVGNADNQTDAVPTKKTKTECIS